MADLGDEHSPELIPAISKRPSPGVSIDDQEDDKERSIAKAALSIAELGTNWRTLPAHSLETTDFLFGFVVQ
jgi:hypothetical protein